MKLDAYGIRYLAGFERVGQTSPGLNDYWALAQALDRRELKILPKLSRWLFQRMERRQELAVKASKPDEAKPIINPEPDPTGESLAKDDDDIFGLPF